MTVTNDHVAHVLARVRAPADMAEIVFEGDVTGNPEVYINAFNDTGMWTGHDYTEQHNDLDITFTFQGVGETREQAVWALDHVDAQLRNWRPTIAGRTCWRMQHAGSQTVARDEDADPIKFFGATRWTLHSTPA